MTKPPIIPLVHAPGAGASWGRPKYVVFLWNIFEKLFVTNSWQISSKIRRWALVLFGAQIGKNVILRPRMRVQFPWKLKIGDSSWIGEGVWIHNQDHVSISHDVVISQESFITTGSHAHRKDMGLITRPITIKAGVWVTSRCIVLGGTDIGESSLIEPMAVISGKIPPNSIVDRNNKITGKRFV
jgi:putative colanic acid biosynthesis acetyltransferase WcaF